MNRKASSHINYQFVHETSLVTRGSGMPDPYGLGQGFSCNRRGEACLAHLEQPVFSDCSSRFENTFGGSEFALTRCKPSSRFCAALERPSRRKLRGRGFGSYRFKRGYRFIHVQSHGLRGNGGILSGDGSYQILVQVLNSSQLAGLATLESAQGNFAQGFADAFDQVGNHGVATGLSDGNVQLHVEVGVGLWVGLLLLHLGDDLLHFVQLLGAAALGGEEGGFGFDAASDLEQFDNRGVFDLHGSREVGQEGFVGQVADNCAASVDDFDQSLSLQRFQGFAYHRAADSEHFGKSGFAGQGFAGAQSIADQGSQLAGCLFG